MERNNRIYPNRKTARMIASDFMKNTGKKIDPSFVHWLADKKGFQKHPYGKEIYYASNLRSVLDNNYYTLYPIFLKEKEQKRLEREKPRNMDYYPDKFIEPDRSPRFYIPESKVRKIIREAIDELELFHGSPHDFNEFDFAYMSSGWGQQAYGYGAYLTTEYECAKEYSQGGTVYTVEIPNKPYLNNDKITPAFAMKVARIFFNYYMKEHEYGKEAYAGCENEFWDGECKYIGECTDGKNLYGTISSILGSDKDTSEFLYNRIGLKGLVWVETNSVTGKKFKNYVIFNPKDIKILKKDSVG